MQENQNCFYHKIKKAIQVISPALSVHNHNTGVKNTFYENRLLASFPDFFSTGKYFRPDVRQVNLAGKHHIHIGIEDIVVIFYGRDLSS